MAAPDDGFALILTTASSEQEALRIARLLVEARLAACVSIAGPVRSIYRYKGEICDEAERMLWIKTTRARFAEVSAAIRAAHSYENPEIVLLPITDGSEPYLGWILENVGEAAG